MTQVFVPRIREATVRQEREQVQVIVDGRAVLELPYAAALQLARAIYTQARRAEEFACAEQIVADQAIATRLGLPLGFTRLPHLLKQAANEAAWNTQLRHYIPPARAVGVHNQTVFGTPAVVLAKEE